MVAFGSGRGNFRLREFRRGNQALGLSAEVHHHALFRVGDHLHFNNFVLRGRCFLRLAVLVDQLAHLLRAGGLFGGSGGFGIGGRGLRVRFRVRVGLFGLHGLRGRGVQREPQRLRVFPGLLGSFAFLGWCGCCGRYGVIVV